jgi:hypothetical protein
MTCELAREFIDSVTFEDCVCRLNNLFYFCYGLVWDENKGLYRLQIDKFRRLYPETDFVETVLDVKCKSKEECMKCFLENPIWDGRKYWDAVPEMVWTDYAGNE